MERKKVANENREHLPLKELSQGFLNVQQIANYLGVKASTVYSMVEEKKISHYRVGRLVRFKKSEVDEWMEGQREAVVDVKMEASRVIRSLQRRAGADVDRIVKKAVEEAGEKRYTSHNGKSDRSKGLGKEASDGTF